MAPPAQNSESAPYRSQNGLAYGALTLSAVGLLLAPMIVGFLPAAAGVALGEVGRRRADRGENVPRKVCEWAVYLGFAGLVLTALLLAFLLIWNRISG